MSTQRIWGATPDDWSSLSLVAGLVEDLLPVVSNSGAKVSPDSNLKALGKVPSLYNASGEVVGISQWVEKHTTHKDIDRWMRRPDYGICIQTRHLRALDIDLDDGTWSAQAVEIFAGALDFALPIPLRSRPNSGKCLLAFYVDGEYTKRIMRTNAGNIEFLATGQHFVAVGTHPSGVRYQWQHVDTDTGEQLLGLPDDFPALTREQFEAGWAALSHHMAIDEVIEYGTGRTLKEARRAVDVPDPHADYLKANGWVLSSTRDGRLNIRCPFEATHSSPSADDTGTQYMPAGVGGFQQGHFRCLHASCAGREDNEFLEKVGAYENMFEPIEPEPLLPGAPVPPPDALQRNGEGKILTHLANVVVAVRAGDWLGCEVGRDRFRDELMIRQGGAVGPQGWRTFSDADYSRIRLALHSKGLRAVGNEMVRDAINLVADENGFDSAQTWLNEIVPAWDGVPRVAAFYRSTFGVPQDEYCVALGLYTWTALAGRILDPGCQVDMVPILKGDQGIGKSACIREMVPDYAFFAELDLSERDENMSRLMRGRMIAEFGELRGLHTKDQEAIKAFITRRWENWIPKYREFATTFPRRLLFMGTTNQQQILADETGNRRWLPVECQQADWDYVRNNRLQLWAEGRELWRAGGIQWADAQRLAEGRHADSMIVDVWQAPIREWIGNRFEGDADAIRLEDVLVGAMGFESRNITRLHEMRANAALRALGYERRQIMRNGARGWYWLPKNMDSLRYPASTVLQHKT